MKIIQSSFLYSIIYLILALYFLQFFQYQINADGISLLSISKSIKVGEINALINSYWGPTSPILIAPFLYFNFENILISVKLSNILIGFFGIYFFSQLTKIIITKNSPRILLDLVSLLLFLTFTYSFISSDLLIVTLLLLLLNLVVSGKIFSNLKYGISTGLICSILFLTKEFFLYYLTALITTIFAIEVCFYKFNFYKLKLFLIIVLLILFTAISWGILLKNKYGYFMFGSRSSVNFALFSPNATDYPFFTKGLIKPVSETSLSAWDEPSLLLKSKFVGFESLDNFVYYVNLVIKNSKLFIVTLHNFSPAILPSFIFTILYLLIKVDKKNYSLFILTIIFISYPIGYLILSLEARYIWINYLLGLIFSFYILSIINTKNRLISLILILSIFLPPLKQATNYLRHYKYIDHTFYDQAKLLEHKYKITNKKVASNNNWHHNLYISAYNNNQYFGILKPSNTFDESRMELENNNIDYYFAWNDDPYLEKFKLSYDFIKPQEIQNLYIFNLRDPKVSLIN